MSIFDDISRGENFSGSLEGNGTSIVGTSGNDGGYILLDGSDDYVLATTFNASADIGSGNPCTLDAWFNADAEGQQMFFSCPGGSRFYIECIGSGGSFLAHWGFGSNQNSGTSTATITTGAWYNYVATYDAVGTIKGYLNGELKDTETGVGSMTFSSVALRLGMYETSGTTLEFDGKLGPIKIYDIALSAGDVLQNYNAIKDRYTN